MSTAASITVGQTNASCSGSSSTSRTLIWVRYFVHRVCERSSEIMDLDRRCPRLVPALRVKSCALRQDNQQHDDDGSDDGRCQRAAQRQAAVGHWLINEVPYRRTERSRQDEGDPKQNDARYPGPVIQSHDHHESDAEHQGAAFVAKSAGVGKPIAECGTQCLRKRDGRPVEGLYLRRRNGAYRNRSLRPMPKPEGGQQTGQQQKRSTCVADPQRPIGKVGQRGAECCGGHNRRPIQHRVETFGEYLRGNQGYQCDAEKHAAGQVAPVQRHRYGVAACFAKRCRQDLDDPKAQRDCRHLGQRLFRNVIHQVMTFWLVEVPTLPLPAPPLLTGLPLRNH